MFGMHLKTELDSKASRTSEQRPIATLQDVQDLAIIQPQVAQAASYTLFTSILNNEGGIWRDTTQYLSVISRVPFASPQFNSVNHSIFPSSFSQAVV
jgi:hypothetical protein